MPNPHADAEFAVLRQTIARRGTTRMVLVTVTFIGWATLAVVLLLFGNLPVATLFPLMVLIGGFEAIHALHVGTDRIGRYLQVYYEKDPEGPRWETTALAVGPALPGGGIDPLFSVIFTCAAVVNLIPLLVPRPTWLEVGIVATFHVAFLAHIVRARLAASRQRAVELESFKALLQRERL